MFFIAVRNNIIICGGHTGNWSRVTREQILYILGDCKLQLPPLPTSLGYKSVFLNNDYELLIIGNGFKMKSQCYKFIKGSWKKQNPPCKVPVSNRKSSFTMQDGVYISCPYSFEFLPKGQEAWKKCSKFSWSPSPGDMSHSVAVSKTEIVSTGGTETTTRIHKYNLIEGNSTEIGKLKHGRWMHSSAFYKGKLIITGGYNYKTTGRVLSTEIIDLASGISRLGGNLNAYRCYHGMGVISKNDKPTLIVFGGECFDVTGCPMSLDSIEEWDDETDTWRISDLKLDIGRFKFDWCSLEEF